MPQDKWTWHVRYTDDTELHEFDEDGTEHGFGEVNLPHVKVVAWTPTRKKSRLPSYVVQIDSLSGQRPILFRRRSIIIDAEGQHKGQVIHCLGWQRTIAGHNIASYTFIFEDGSTLLTDNHQAV